MKKRKLINKSLSLIVIMLLMAFTNTMAQNFVPNEIYFKLNQDVRFEFNKDSRAMKLERFDQIISKDFFNKYGVTGIDAEFYFSKSDVLRRTFRMKFKDTNVRSRLIKELGTNPAIEYAEPMLLNRKSFTPNDLGDDSSDGQWALHTINAIDAWDLETGEAEIVVAVIDDAVHTYHEDLLGKCLTGKDIADNNDNPNPLPESYDCYSHGTHVAGIIGAKTHNNTGVASIGYNISILPVKCNEDDPDDIYDENGNLISPCGIVQFGYAGVTWAAENEADIINMSWGGHYPNTPEYASTLITLQNVMTAAWNEGAILVASAGNSGNNLLNYPAAFDNVISVANTNIDDEIFHGFPPFDTVFPPFGGGASSYGYWVDVSAPGTEIISTRSGGGYEKRWGTSMAAPLVAGLLGLVWSVDPNIDRQEIIDCVLNTADDIDGLNSGFEGQLGSGRINAHEAVKCAFAKACPEDLVISTTYGLFSEVVESASNTITGANNNLIGYAATVTYKAGNAVILEPGFRASWGSSFYAKIEDCTYNLKGYDSPTPNDIKSIDYNLTAYPNPLSDQALITYTLEEAATVSLSVRDLAGKVVVELANGIKQESGSYQHSLDASQLSSGMYIYTLQVDGEINSKKLMIAR